MTRRSLSVLVLVLVLAVAGCGGSSDAKGPTGTVGSPKTTEPTTTTTAKPATPEAEVEAAYLKSWDVYAKAVRELDSTDLESAYADSALQTVREEVDRLRRSHTPVEVKVDHNYHVQIVESGRGVVIDAYTNHSVFVDPSTGQPTEPDPDEKLVETYTVKESQGSWKVVGITRQ